MAQLIRLCRGALPIQFVLFAGVLAFTSAANAASVTAKLTSVDMTSFSVTVVNSSGTYTESGGAGKFHWDGSVAGGSNPTGLNGAFTSFCIDLKDWVSIGSTFTYDLADLKSAPILNGAGAGINAGLAGGMGATKANVLSLLFGQHYNDVVDAATAGAFQAAIWEIVYEDVVPTFTDYDVTQLDPGSSTFGFKINSPGSVTSTANTWLHSLNSAGPKMSLAAITSSTYQDQIVVVPTPTAVTAGFGLLGTLGLAGLAQRRRKTHAMM
jgi:hypothetical protein